MVEGAKIDMGHHDGKVETGNTNERERLSTIDLLTEVACF